MQDLSTIRSADSLAIKVTFIALEQMPAVEFEPLESHVRLVVATRRDVPVLPTARMTSGVRLNADTAQALLADLNAGKYGRTAPIAILAGNCIPGVTASFALQERQGQPDLLPGDLLERHLEVDIYRPPTSTNGAAATTLQIGLGMDDFVKPDSPRTDLNSSPADHSSVATRRNIGKGEPALQTALMPPGPTPVYQREMVLFDRPAQTADFALLIPIRFAESQSSAVAALIEISAPSGDAAYQQTLSHTLDDLKKSTRSAGLEPNAVKVDPPDWPGLSSALDSLKWSDRQRAGLAFLAGQTGAGIAEDVALSADATVVSELADAVRKAISPDPAKDRKSVGWVLDRTTLQMLAQLQAGNKIPPELAAILAIHAGEAGRSSDTLREVMAGASSEQDLQNRLATENYIFLQDSSPAARVRALDWLRTRGLAPAGFDPLGAARDRRAALEKAQQAAVPQQ